MGEKVNTAMIAAIREAETSLVNGEFRSLGSESRNSRLTGAEIEAALREYGSGVVTPVPQEEIEALEAIHIRDSNPPEWAVDVPVFINGQESDLTLSLTLSTTTEGKLIATVDNLHVL